MIAKRVVQDIVPSERKPSSRRITRAVHSERTDDEIPVIIKKRNVSKKEVVNENPVHTRLDTKSKLRSKYSKIFTFGAIFLCVAIIALALSLLYSRAIVTITPSTIPINLDGNFFAKKDSNTSDILNYKVVTVNFNEYKTVPATDGPLIQTKAKGTVTLYNNYSSTTQKILAGTRISSSNGLIYKTTWTVVIPAKKLVKGKMTPGFIDVGVIADQAGSEYNIKVADYKDDFKIVAYKGTAKYTGFYGKIKKDIIGGFSGKKKIISAKLLKNASLAVLDDLVFFDNAYTIEYEKLPPADATDGVTSIGMKGTLYAIIFNSKSLVEFIAKKQITENKLSTYTIEGLDTLKFDIVNTKEFSVKNGTPLSFSLNGSIRIVGTFSEKELKTKLLGIKLDQMSPIIKQYPSIKNVSVLLTPFWMRSFPNSAEKIIFEYK
jgi:hypothetical protein